MAVLRDVIRGLQAECKNQCRQVDRTADYVQMKTAINNTILTRSRQSIKTEWSRDQRECVEECHAVNKHLPKNLETDYGFTTASLHKCYSGRMFKTNLNIDSSINLINSSKEICLVLHSHISRFFVVDNISFSHLCSSPAVTDIYLICDSELDINSDVRSIHLIFSTQKYFFKDLIKNKIK